MEQDVRDMTSREFGIDWKLPIVADGNVGFRFGGLVELEGIDLEGALRGVVRQTVEHDRSLRRALKTGSV